MKRPRRKVLPSSSADVLKEPIPEALAMKYRDMVYDGARPCPKCGCGHVARYNVADTTLCTTIVDGSSRPIGVRVKGFECSTCGSVFEGKPPFYDRCSNGAPIVDLCLALTSSNPYSRVESILMQ